MSLPRLLPTKFICPPLRSDLILRETLLARLGAAYQSGARLALICAPAGYGKTTLAAAWMEGCPGSAWVTLEPADNDPARFFTALVTALRKADPAVGQRIPSQLEMPQLPALTSLVDELVSDLAGLAEPFVLAVDDYHVIQVPALHEAVEHLLNTAPPALRLLITTREDPPFPLSRLRARGQLCELRLRDLRFTLSEVDSFLSRRMGFRLDSLSLERLEQLTEGWPAGLQLAGLAMSDQPDPAAWLEENNAAHPYLIEYLLEEVLRRQGDEVRQFLRQTCILDRFNADLCDDLRAAVRAKEEDDDPRGSQPSAAVLAALERANLFLIPLDHSRTWYRYHHLFADVLRASLERGEAAWLHRQAARWFEEHDEPGEALGHALQADEPAEAVRLIRSQAGERLRYGELHTLRSWIAALPPNALMEALDLAMLQALCLLLTGEPGTAAGLVRQVDERGAAGLTPEQQGRLLALRAWVAMVLGGDLNVAAVSRQALDLLGPRDAIFRVMALLALGSGEAWGSRIEQSTSAFREAYDLAQSLNHPFGELTALANLSFNLFHQGQMREAIRLCQDAVSRWLDPRGQPLPVAGMALLPLSAFYLERGELDQAEAAARQAQDLMRKNVSSTMMGGDTEQVLAEAAAIRGDLAQAMEIIEATRSFAAERRIYFLDYKMTLLAANCCLRAGDLDSARREASRLDNLSAGLPNPQRARLVLGARLALAEGRPAEALDWLADPEQAARGSRPGLLVSILAVKACALDQLGRAVEADQAFAEALRLAAPDGYRRSILNAGRQILPLLARARQSAPDFASSLLAEMGSSLPQALPQQPARPIETSPDLSVAEPLSEQERRVLRLLTAGRSNAEIAAELYIGLGTAKWHVHNILGKLGVASRAEAMVRARELGLDR